MGLVERDNGNIFWKEEKIEKARNIFVKSVFYQGHQLSLKNTFSVLENLKFSHSAFNLSEKEILNSLTITGLKDLASMPSSDLSMGQLKKLAISAVVTTAAIGWPLPSGLPIVTMSGMTSCVSKPQ